MDIDARNEDGVPTESHGICGTESVGNLQKQPYVYVFGAYFVMLMVYGNCLCYRARKIETVYAEGKYLAFALFNNLQV